MVARPVWAESPPDPLRLIPGQADAFIKIDNPRRLIEAVTNFDILKQLQQFQVVQEYNQSTNQRRFLQFVAYFEKELRVKWPDLADRLAGGGVVAALKFGSEPPRAGLVIQGKDADLLRRFVRLGCSVIEQELARQESRAHLERQTYRNLETYHVGQEFNAAVAGTALFVANRPDVLHLLIDTHLDGKKSVAQNPTVAEARKLLPARPLAWGWLNLDPVHNNTEAKEFFAQPRNDPFVTVGFGGWLDVARRSSFLCAAIYQDDRQQLITTVRMPQGREGMPAEVATHIPPVGTVASLPLLEPKGVILSQTSYLDPAKFWECRHQLFNEQQVKTFEDADKKSAPILLGNRISKLLTQAGPHQRFVIVNPVEPVHTQSPVELFGSLRYGLVVDMRDPGFARSLETLMRGAGLLARTQVKLNLVEEKYHDVTILGFRFPEQEPPNPAVRNAIRYLSSPSFAKVGDQVVIASTLDLCHELVDLVQAESQGSGRTNSSAPSHVTRLYGAGAAVVLKAIEDQLFTQTVLSQALAPDEARGQVTRLIDWVRGLGSVELKEDYRTHDFRYELIYTPTRARSASK
jgi:hypothetical protein